MIWFMVMQVVSILVELVRLARQFGNEKDLEILLRWELTIYERRQGQALRLSRGEKPVVLATCFIRGNTNAIAQFCCC
jgi:hypothetical protein